MAFFCKNPDELLGVKEENKRMSALEASLTALSLVRKLLIPAAAVVTVSKPDLKTGCVKCANCHCKPSELPIYSTECQSCKPKAVAPEHSELESAIGKVRSELWVLGDGVKGYKQQVVDFVETGIAHSSLSIDFLREESHGPERAGAIALASLSGLVFGLRGGFIKRITYMTLGGLSMAGVCYPKEAAEYSELAIVEGNKYFVAGYHFMFGESPKVPEWLGSAWGDTQEKIKEVKSMIK